MAAHNPTISAELEPHQNATAKGLDDCQALASFRPAERCFDRTTRNCVKNLINERQTLLDLADAEPNARIDVTFIAPRHFERQLVIGCVGKRAPGIEGAAGCTADIPAGAELRRQFRLYDSCCDGPVLQRSRVVVELNQVWKNFAHRSDQSRSLSKTLRRDIAA